MLHSRLLRHNQNKSDSAIQKDWIEQLFRHHYVDEMKCIFPITDIHAFHLTGYVNDYYRVYRRITRIGV